MILDDCGAGWCRGASSPGSVDRVDGKNHKPPLDHEYQLLLSTDAGRLAFDRSLAFLNAHAK